MKKSLHIAGVVQNRNSKMLKVKTKLKIEIGQSYDIIYFAAKINLKELEFNGKVFTSRNPDQRRRRHKFKTNHFHS